MRLLCPDCRLPFALQDDFSDWDQGAVACPAGHPFRVQAGVLELLDAPLARTLDGFLSSFGALRADEQRRLTDPALYPLLPDAPAVRGEFEWRLRRYDLAVALDVCGRGAPRRILDLGAWNGWLSNRLAEQGHEVTAIDYFVDPFDGLQARQFYRTRWRAVQMNLEELAVLNEQYDAVIVNRCLQFYADPPAYAEQVRQKVAPGGVALLTGLAFLRDPSQRLAGLAALRARLNQRGADFFKPMKGYLDFDDRARLAAQGWQLHPYRQLLAANARALLDGRAPRYDYALWKNHGAG